MKNRTALTLGLLLILLGVLFLFQQFVPTAWPLTIVMVGGIFLVAAVLSPARGLAIPGSLIAGTGLILLYQATTHDWDSWFALWPLVSGSLGLGMLIASLLGEGGSGLRRTGIVFLALGVILAGALWVLRGQPWVNWTTIIYGQGLFFLFAAILLWAGGLAIPGVILGVLGVILSWQFATGNWESWAYLWPALPGSVGVGLVILGLMARKHARVLITVGLYIAASATIVMILFATFFGENVPFLRFWPVLIVLLGLVILVDALVPRSKSIKTE